MKTPITITMAVALIATACPSFAQDSAESESTPTASSSANQRPEFVPMTRSEHFRTYLTGTFGPGSLAKAAAIAGLGQLRDSPKEWPRGGEGYADRLGNAYAKHIIRGTLQYGASSALHQDDRYVRSGETGFWNRAKYAIASTFLARRDNGQRTFAYARFSSAAGAAFISRAWQPASTSGASSAASSFGFTIAADLGSNLLREFWPNSKHRRN